MYTNEDLDTAITEGIFTKESVSTFRNKIASLKNTPSADEENFKLITGFNDIYVVIACALLLISASWALRAFNESLALLSSPILSWGLAEFFVLKRKMALPAIVLLLTFVGGIFNLGTHFFQGTGESIIVATSALSAVATYAHWQRFRVPVTIAVGTVVIIALIVSSLLMIEPKLNEWTPLIICVSGILTFLFAMRWDASDRRRTSHHSDVAFWLHLISAPLIVHPVFSNLSMNSGNESLYGIVIVITLYLLMTVISLIIDRRAFMISSLAYVLYAISDFLDTFGAIDYGFAITGTIISSALLLLSAFWRPSRVLLLSILPSSITQYVPTTNIKL